MTSPTHALIAIGIGSFVVPRDLDRARAQLILGACCAVLPDLDLLAPYLGGGRDFHRGFTHSLSFAGLVGLACAWYEQLGVGQGARRWQLGCYAALATVAADQLRGTRGIVHFPADRGRLAGRSENEAHLVIRPVAPRLEPVS